MGLNSFSYGSYCGGDTIPEKVLLLFSDALENGEKTEYAADIIKAGMKGKIKFDGRFNLKAYEYKIGENSYLTKQNRLKRELYIDYACADESATNTGRVNSIREDHLSRNAELSDFEKVDNADELRDAVRSIKELNKDMIIYEGVDLIKALSLAVKGRPVAIDIIKDVCAKYKYISNYIQMILQSGCSVSELFYSKEAV